MRYGFALRRNTGNTTSDNLTILRCMICGLYAQYDKNANN